MMQFIRNLFDIFVSEPIEDESMWLEQRQQWQQEYMNFKELLHKSNTHNVT